MFSPSTVNRLEYMTFLTIGLSYLWPWNCFLSAVPYFHSRLAGHLALQQNLSSSLMIISTVTSTATFILLAFKRTPPAHKTSKVTKHTISVTESAVNSGEDEETVNYENRVILGELLIGAVFIVLAGSCVLFTNSSSGIGYFLFLLLAIFSSTLGTSLAQNGSFAIVSLFGPIYTQAIMVGQAIAGILPPIVSMLSIISSLSRDDDKPGTDEEISGKSTFFYFLVASLAALIAFTLFKLVLKTGPEEILTNTEPESSAVLLHDEAVHSYNSLLAESPTTANVEDDYDYDLEVLPSGRAHEVDPYKLILKLRVPIFTVFSVFSVTLAYPVFSELVLPVHTGSVIFNRNVFIPFAMFVWNLGDLAGRLICGSSKWVVRGDKNFIMYSIGRFAFLPAYLLFTNINGRLTNGGGAATGLSQWLGDEVFLVIHFLFGFTNGHLGSSAMMASPSYVDPEEREKGGSLMTLALSLGLTVGALFSLALVHILA
ncbi:hypothetical protein DV113_000412 [Geotrichum candidum]|uniref:Similar to Saccharomyces cerevisiae YAL022C FUN26 Vacuolar membrane transporter with broad nucleoside selectivity n=1 Tax=Geotrichum candidum TaxID=1173061 RepID=A0A0J9XBX6_GEOCN|nr:hypothetical protein DV452_000933 [Geotrichum candidum]KAF7501508.1 hypothetical protein DV113_000412 [Geotrichum candidum]KAI8131722.1 hypothetical protein DUD61_004631 [Geotrichum candidum]KAI9210893.1 hypothetical protein DS838_004228 [Geotrichum bryndzae]CDO54344.1 similar to Saccharomyces cerevisiae YAL022C FUN26 Vacuolar membrane transporter with broad nucleoside selectivity [Geotrichum candidum]